MRVLVAISLLASLGACTSFHPFHGSTSPKPVSIGGGANALKRAPCAGCELRKQLPGLPPFLQNANSRPDTRA